MPYHTQILALTLVLGFLTLVYVTYRVAKHRRWVELIRARAQLQGPEGYFWAMDARWEQYRADYHLVATDGSEPLSEFSYYTVLGVLDAELNDHVARHMRPAAA